jgi:Xaa-Pro aminopeptidase
MARKSEERIVRQTLSDKIGGIQAIMRENKMDLVLVTPSSDLFYAIGRNLPQTERFNALLLPVEGQAAILVPKLQEPLVSDLSDQFEVLVWDETQDPVRLASDYIASKSASSVAVDGHMWANFLLRLQAMNKNVIFHNASDLLAPLRECKSKAELAILEDLGSRFDNIWQEFVRDTAILGMTEREVTFRIGELARKHGFDSLAWCDVGSGPNGASPLHHWSDRPILAGDPIVIDFAAKKDGYYMDTCRTPVAGPADPEFQKIYDIVNRAYEAALAEIAPGVPAESVDRAARDVISEAGFGDYFIHRVGHGLGIDAHEAPYIVSGNTEPLREGMVFSIEPGIYIPDRWGVRIENIIAVTADAGIALNNFGRELVEMK